MSIPLQTLVLILVLLMAQAAVAMLFLTLGHPQEQGVKQAGLAMLVQATGTAMVLILWDRPTLALGLDLGLVVLLAGACYLFISVRLIYGRRVNRWYLVVAAFLLILSCLPLLALHGAPRPQLNLVSCLLGLVSLLSAREFARPTRDETWPGARWFCAVASLLFALAALGWGLMPLMAPRDAGLGQTDVATRFLCLAAFTVYGFLGLGLTLVLAQRLQARQERFTQSDLITGLLNRRGFEAYAERVIARARLQGQFTSLLLLSVDHFKTLQDTHGHGAGELALEGLGDLLHQQLRERDGAGRFGGEVMLVLLPETHHSFAQPVAERIRRAVETMEIPWEGRRIPMTISVGAASTAESDSDLASLFTIAEMRLGRAQAHGGNVVVAES